MESSRRNAAGGLSWLPFGLTALLLAGTAFVSLVAVKQLRGAFSKEAAPLRKSLDRLDKDRLAPWKWVRAYTIEAAVLNTLGTDLYINWKLENESRRVTDPLRYCQLFITYYTGKPDLVPHIPEVCWIAQGYDPVGPCESMKSEVVLSNGEVRELPFRTCTFKKTQIFGGVEPTVVYTFHANGQMVPTRDDVRSVINKFAAKHAYFSKIEMSFGTPDGRAYASREDSIEEARTILSAILPILESEHFPDWEALENASEQDSEQNVEESSPAA